jgi:hypothetical protein
MRPPAAPLIPVAAEPYPLEVRHRIHQLVAAGNTIVRVDAHSDSSTGQSFKIVYTGPPVSEWIYDVEVDR